jgi:phage baseplate assembly protein W
MSALDTASGAWENYPQVGSGWSFPVRWDDAGPVMSGGADRIREAIELLIRTGVSERVMLPRFGAGIDRYVFDPRTDDVCRRLEEDVRRALLLTESRVIVDSLEAVPAGSAEDRIDVVMAYRIDRHRRPENLVLPFYFAGENS